MLRCPCYLVELSDVCLAASITLLRGFFMPGCLCYLVEISDVCLADCYFVELPDVCIADWYLAELTDVCLAASITLVRGYSMPGNFCYLSKIAYVCLAIYYLFLIWLMYPGCYLVELADVCMAVSVTLFSC